MPQLILPLIPSGTTPINNMVSVRQQDDRWTYFLGAYPIGYHITDDIRMFRLITSQLIDGGLCRQVEILRTFNVPKRTVIRSVAKLRKEGPQAFFEKKKSGRPRATVLTKDVLEQAQSLLDQGKTRGEVSEALEVQYDTLRKAINDGRLKEVKSSKTASNKSTRSAVDVAASTSIGTACTRVEERVLASMGKGGGAVTRFEHCLDVPRAGVLCALPALIANGLLDGAEEMLGQVSGYYKTVHILLMLAFLALCRIKTPEEMRGHAPGELGKLLGLDRVPEVRCLREKMDALSSGDSAELWAAQLSKQWMGETGEAVGTLYIDGHVRVYHGRLTKLPRRYIARDRLCMRGVSDYWVNDLEGRPIFVVEKPNDPGLIKTLQEDIVPRLLQEISGQPTEEELNDNPKHYRFIMVFDREGYSPGFFKKMWEKHRIACVTYHKYPGEEWPLEIFADEEVILQNGETVSMRLAERESLVGSGKNAMKMREVRKLTKSGHQTSFISTVFEMDYRKLAPRMFGRWCQENFFKYMMKHFGLEALFEYGTEAFPDTEKVVNPAWRVANKLRASVRSKVKYRRAKVGEATMQIETRHNNPKKLENWVRKKGLVVEELECYERELEEIKAELKAIPKHITWGELAEEDKYNKLLPRRKRLMNTIGMISYRSETSMAKKLTGSTVDTTAARRLLQDLFVTEADILPSEEEGVLLIRIHGPSRPAAGRELIKLLEHLNQTETIYPGTDLRMIYELVGQEVLSAKQVPK